MKAVIPCGGLGTRFLPITKSIPKELLPIVDVPVLSYIINESINSGVTEVLIVLLELRISAVPTEQYRCSQIQRAVRPSFLKRCERRDPE